MCVCVVYMCVGVVVVVSGSTVGGFAARTGENKWVNAMDSDR